ncbi:Gas vesicle protein K [Prosthecochloris sp. CIB 2401]|nr:gas vesicle protein K [Prosthecochloris sp. CIB 2401]ANT64674.1 Gas vesicle protein K [Prosthecochloris sp. CIB 2401]
MSSDNKILFGQVDASMDTDVESVASSLDVPERIDINPDNVEHGLAKLVLTLVEVIRQLIEKQALRRLEGGSLTDEEIEKLGESLALLENKMQELKGVFNLSDEDLNLDLGPLGKLL